MGEFISTSWMQALNEFDGNPEDCFTRTSMHLSFTEWKSSILVRESIGLRSMGFCVMEAAVQVRDAGEWIADVNISEALENSCIRRCSDLPSCKHVDRARSFGDCMALETWDQALDGQEGIVVTKSHKNWVARLALASVLAQHSKVDNQQIIICPPEVCGKCISESIHTRNVVIID